MPPGDPDDLGTEFLAGTRVMLEGAAVLPAGVMADTIVTMNESLGMTTLVLSAEAGTLSARGFSAWRPAGASLYCEPPCESAATFFVSC